MHMELKIERQAVPVQCIEEIITARFDRGSERIMLPSRDASRMYAVIAWNNWYFVDKSPKIDMSLYKALGPGLLRNFHVTIFRTGIWFAGSTAASQSEAMLVNPR